MMCLPENKILRSIVIASQVVIVLFFAQQIIQQRTATHFSPSYSVETENTGNWPTYLCDASTEGLYFLNRKGSDTELRILDYNGQFLRMFRFRDSTKGVPFIRCQDNLCYIRLRNDTVFVFSMDDLLYQMSSEEATSAGYTETWFAQAQSRLTIDQNYLYLRNTDGTVSQQIEKPDYITVTQQMFEISTLAESVIKVLVLILFFCVFVWITADFLKHR